MAKSRSLISRALPMARSLVSDQGTPLSDERRAPAERSSCETSSVDDDVITSEKFTPFSASRRRLSKPTPLMEPRARKLMISRSKSFNNRHLRHLPAQLRLSAPAAHQKNDHLFRANRIRRLHSTSTPPQPTYAVLSRSDPLQSFENQLTPPSDELVTFRFQRLSP